MTRLFMIAAGVLFASSAWADDRLESMQLAQNLGNVLASEATCGFQYDQGAIAAFIEQNVAATDMDFTSTLSLMTSGSKFQLDQMSESARTAQCKQAERVARSNGFIK